MEYFLAAVFYYNSRSAFEAELTLFRSFDFSKAIIALLHFCIIALLHYCIIALLHYCIIALLHTNGTGQNTIDNPPKIELNEPNLLVLSPI